MRTNRITMFCSQCHHCLKSNSLLLLMSLLAATGLLVGCASSPEYDIAAHASPQHAETEDLFGYSYQQKNIPEDALYTRCRVDADNVRIQKPATAAENLVKAGLEITKGILDGYSGSL